MITSIFFSYALLLLLARGWGVAGFTTTCATNGVTVRSDCIAFHHRASTTITASAPPKIDAGVIDFDIADHHQVSRRRTFTLTTSAIFTGMLGVATVIAGPSTAMAADTFEDLSMPSEAQPVSSTISEEDQIMQERLKRKAELKKQAAEPKNFVDSLKGERTKQQEMNRRSKEEQRAALCEELGRGC